MHTERSAHRTIGIITSWPFVIAVAHRPKGHFDKRRNSHALPLIMQFWWPFNFYACERPWKMRIMGMECMVMRLWTLAPAMRTIPTHLIAHGMKLRMRAHKMRIQINIKQYNKPRVPYPVHRPPRTWLFFHLVLRSFRFYSSFWGSVVINNRYLFGDVVHVAKLLLHSRTRLHAIPPECEHKTERSRF